MKTTLCSLILSACSVAAPAAAATNLTTASDSPACLQKAGPAIVTLFTMDRRYQHPTGQAAGFFIRDDGVLVTDRHVSEHNDALVAVTADGKPHRVTGFYGEDRDYDVAVVKIEGNGFAHLSLASASLPQPGQPVTVVSPDTNAHLFCTTGTVERVTSLPNIFEMILLRMPLHPGQSGSPLLNESGDVIGIACGIRTDGNGYGVPVRIVQGLLDRAGAGPPIRFAKRPRKGTAVPVVLDNTFRAAEAAITRKDWTAAEPLLKQAAKRFPESPLVLTLLGVTYLERQRWKDAEASFAKVVRLKPDSAFGWLAHGTSSIRRGRYAKGDKALRRSIELGLTDKAQLTDAWIMVAVADAVRKDGKGAKEALRNLDGLDPAKAEEVRRAIRQDYPRLAL